jgi:predicted dinucleotide-binding enzyme
MSPGMPLRIAIIGAGSIGAALAAHLILAGNNVEAYKVAALDVMNKMRALSRFRG